MGILDKSITDEEEKRILRFIVEEGYSQVKCTNCGQLRLRKFTGKRSKNLSKKYYVNEAGRIWRGKHCPDCSAHKQTRHMTNFKKRAGTLTGKGN